MNILVIKPSSLGDIFHTLPAVRILKDAYPDASIAWIVSSQFRPIVNLFADVDEVIEFRRNDWGKLRNVAELMRFLWGLRQRTFDLVLDFQGLFRSGACAFFAASPTKVGFANARELASIFYTQKVVPPPEIKHAVDKNLYLVAAVLNLPPGYQPPRFKTSPEAARTADDMLRASQVDHSRQPLVAVAPGSRWPSKRWPTHFFTETIGDILAASGPEMHVWLLGTGDERPMGEEIVRAVGSNRISNWIGATELPVMFELLKRSRILITNDSGPMHIAAALQVATVSFFGPTDPEKTGPYGTNHKIFRTQVSCAPCFHKTCPLERQLCIDDVITPAAVSAYVVRRLVEP